MTDFHSNKWFINNKFVDEFIQRQHTPIGASFRQQNVHEKSQQFTRSISSNWVEWNHLNDLGLFIRIDGDELCNSLINVRQNTTLPTSNTIN